MAIYSYPSDEPFVSQPVVDRAIGYIATGVRRQQMDDFVFTDGEAYVHAIPISSTSLWFEDELAASYELVSLAIGDRLV
jgi:hypothetical protein